MLHFLFLLLIIISVVVLKEFPGVDGDGKRENRDLLSLANSNPEEQLASLPPYMQSSRDLAQVYVLG